MLLCGGDMESKSEAAVWGLTDPVDKNGGDTELVAEY